MESKSTPRAVLQRRREAGGYHRTSADDAPVSSLTSAVLICGTREALGMREKASRIAAGVALWALGIIIISLLMLIFYLNFSRPTETMHSEFNPPNPSPTELNSTVPRLFLIWLHSLNDDSTGMANFFMSPELEDYNVTWSNPVASRRPVTCFSGGLLKAWFDVLENPVTLDSAKDEDGVHRAAQEIHAMIDKEITNGINPNHVFVFGIGQGGALALASVLLYPRTLGGGAVIHGWFPLNPSIMERVTPEAKKTPILWSHGINNKFVPTEAAEAGALILEKAGMKCVFKALPNVALILTEEELDLMESWIKSCLQISS